MVRQGYIEKPGFHVRLFGEEDVKVTNSTQESNETQLVKRACNRLGLTLSEFTRMAVTEKARVCLLYYKKERVKMAKQILLEEEMRIKKEQMERENQEET
jgi:hypothetical protein